MSFKLSLSNFLRFYGRLFQTAFKHSLSIADGVGFVLGLAAGIAGQYYPQEMSAVSNLVIWQIPLLALGAVFAIRFVLAPYWMYREKDRQAANFGDQLARFTVSDSTRAKLLELWLTGDRLFNHCNDFANKDNLPEKEVNEWIAEVETFIKERFPTAIGEGYLRLFREHAGITSPGGSWTSPQSDLRDVVDNRKHRLGQIHALVNTRGMTTLD